MKSPPPGHSKVPPAINAKERSSLPGPKKTDGTFRHHAGHLASGTMLSFFSSAICLPTGLITAAFLTRQLGPANYGLLTVTATIIIWIEEAVTVAFTRSAVKFVAESKRWEPVSTRFLQVQLLAALAVTVTLALLSPALGSLLGAPKLAFYLRVYSLTIPVTAMARIHQAFLIGRGRFHRRAILPATYWLSRMLLIVLFVWLRPSVTSAILGSVGASLASLSLARYFIRPPLLAPTDFPIRNVWDYAWPLFFFTTGMNLFVGLDLLFVKGMSTTAEAAGYYGAAKNLTIVPSLFATSFAPLLLAKLSDVQRRGMGGTAQRMTRQSLRLVLWLIPFAGMAAGASGEIVTAIYGSPFLPAAGVLALLIFAAMGIVMITVTTSTLIAAGRPGLPIILFGPCIALSPILLNMFVARIGPLGAAATMTFLAWSGAVTCLVAVHKIWHVLLPPATIGRALILCVIAYISARLWPAPGTLLLIKLPSLAVLVAVGFFLLRELGSEELAFLRGLFSRNPSSRSSWSPRVEKGS